MSLREKQGEQVGGRKKKKTSKHGKDEISLIRTGSYKWGTLLPAQPASRKRVLPQTVLSLEDENLCFSPSVPSLWCSCVLRCEWTCHSSLFMLLSPLLPKVKSLLAWWSLKTKSAEKIYVHRVWMKDCTDGLKIQCDWYFSNLAHTYSHCNPSCHFFTQPISHLLQWGLFFSTIENKGHVL